MRRDRQRLEDVLEAIERIEKYTAGGRTPFDKDELVQTWTLHHFQIIGEAVRGLSEEVRSANPEVPWGQIAAMRNILVHDYFGIDLDEVWNAVVRDLPPLKSKVDAILRTLRT